MGKYAALFSTMHVSGAVYSEAKSIVETKILPHKARYEEVSAKTPNRVPWWWIAIIHHMESGNDFSTHLHNGDPLYARTSHVPSGRPATGEPPFTWEYSAYDALMGNTWVRGQKTWLLENALWLAEEYNGEGYHMHGINSPYVFGKTNQYMAGRYVADHEWDATSVSQQIGFAVLLRVMLDMKEVTMGAPISVQASDVTISLLGNALKFIQGPIGALIMAQAVDPSSIVNTVAHQNFWLGLAVTAIGGVLQHLRTATSNGNTMTALGLNPTITTPPQA